MRCNQNLLRNTKSTLKAALLAVLGCLSFATAYAGLPLSCTVVSPTTLNCGGQICVGDFVVDSLGALLCQPAPVCSLSASTTSIAAGASVTLTAICPGATTYLWTGAGCAGQVGPLCAAAPQTTSAYTVAGTDSSGRLGNASTPVTVTVATPTAPSCATGSGLDITGFTRMTVACTPAGPYTYSWSSGNGGCNGTTNSSCQIVTPSASTLFAVTVTYAPGLSITKTIVAAGGAPQGGPPVCSPSAFPSFGHTTLYSNCTPAANSWLWSGGACQGVRTENCDITSPTSTTTYTVTASNTFGTDSNKAVTVTVAQSTPTCTLNASKAAIGSGESARLTATNCSEATSYAWTGGNCAGTTQATCDFVPTSCTGPTSIGVAGISANGTGASASTSIDVSAPICTLSASPLAAAANPTLVTTTLTASCDRTVTSYRWTADALQPGSLVAGTTNSATVTLPKTAQGTFTYKVAAQNGCGGVDVPVSLKIGVPQCTVTPSSTSINPGGSTTLTASCEPAANSYSWAQDLTLTPVPGTNTATVALPATTPVGTVKTYSVAGTNIIGTGPNSPAASVTAAAGYVMPANCQIIDVNWESDLWTYGPKLTPDQYMTSPQMFAFRLTIHSAPQPTGPFGGARIILAYAGSVHYLNASRNPCEFTPAIEAAGCASFGMNEPILEVRTTPTSDSCLIPADVPYYYNVKNAGSLDGPDTCPPGTDPSNCKYKFVW